MGARFTVTYRLFARSREDARARAEGIALEQTVEVPRDVVSPGYVEDEILGRVTGLEAEPDGATWLARISYSSDAVGNELTQYINVIFGNSSIQKGIKVVGIEPGAEMERRFPGARFGASGIRALTGRQSGGFVCPVIKPQGSDTAHFARLCHATARAGADIVKEDHGLANQPAAPFRDRIPACADAVARANAERQARGDTTRALYFPSILGHGDRVREDAFFAKEAGADGVLIIPGILGFDTMNRLAQDEGFGLPIMAHPAHLGPYVLSPDTGYSHGMMFGTMMRIAGADISVFPNHGGRFGFSEAECAGIVADCRDGNGPGRPILPSPGGGMSMDRLPDMMRLYGPDCVYLLGGSLLRYGDRIGDAIRDMRAALDTGA
ncbi:RuBisCO large subunit C-terminal-like domain-containing protein [Frigidibacter sp. SD6-1]|uniref:RuBisCO large subunit C-terminal-like domain-containing protein n=1 Tax=Frigidibacter sp. SD6-1 TaxID=3032581 RepID=UPI0024E00EE7|nr:RuBisCO large subunit C-terminal-like domain-containing protein [Frigidibacter sp. SD6-1]